MSIPRPANEAARLIWLHESRVLETPAEDAFDDITRLAAQLCDMPMAAVSLIDEERQWFKSVVGLDVTETPRDVAFCAHTILGPGLMIVPDTLEDARFADNPLVTGAPDIRFYAGAPLVTSDGFALGSLCVNDRVPRQLSAQQQTMLEILASQVAGRIELQRQLAIQQTLMAEQARLIEEQERAQEALCQSEEELRAVVDQAMDGVYLFDPYSCRLLKTNASFRDMLGYSEEEAVTLTLYDIIAHPKTSIDRNMAILRRDRKISLGERQYLRRDGTVIIAELSGRVIRHGKGEVFCVVVHEVTERRREEAARLAAEEGYRALFENAAEGIFQTSPDGHYVRANPALARIYGYETPAQMIDELTDIGDQLYVEAGRRVEFQRLMSERGRVSGFESQIYRRDKTVVWISESARPVYDASGMLLRYEGFVEDITERKEAETNVQKERQFLHALLENLSEGIVACDAQGTLRLFNRATRVFHGLPAEPLPPEQWSEHFDIYNADGQTRLKTAEIPLFRAFQGEVVRDTEMVIAPKTTPAHRLLASGQAFYDGQGEKLGAVVVMQDITERRRREEGQRLLLEAGTLLSATFDYETTLKSVAHLAVPGLADLCFFDLVGAEGILKRVGSAHATPQANVGEAEGFVPTQNFSDNPVSKVLATGQPEFIPEVTDAWMQQASAGPERLETMRTSGIVSLMTVPLMVRGAAIGTLTLAFAESQRHYTSADLNLALELCGMAALAVQNARMYQEALDRADRDPLTGLLNHRAFHRLLAEEADRAQREGSNLAVVMLDLDNFRFFNEVYGHITGDAVLRQVAGRLQSVCRSYDTIVRFGGDEFALLLPGTDAMEAVEVEARMRADLGDLSYCPEGQETSIPITVTAGAAVFPDPIADRAAVVQAADERLRRFKTGQTSETEADHVRLSALSRLEGFSMLDALVTAVDNRDRYTRHHSEDVMTYSLMIARELRLGEKNRRTVAVAALLHDVGKIGVPDHVLRKPGTLTDEEFEAIKQHPQMGAIMVGAVPGLEETLDAVRHHHERWDGSGYPFGLKGEDTPLMAPLMARLMAVADAFSAMTTDRPYRKALDRQKAMSILEAGAGTQWDPQCVKALLNGMGKAEPHRSLSAGSGTGAKAGSS